MAYKFCFKRSTISNTAVIVSYRNITAYESSAWLPKILEIKEVEEEVMKDRECLSGNALSLYFLSMAGEVACKTEKF